MSAQPSRVRTDADASRWRRVKRLFQTAMDLPIDARAGFLRHECEDPEIIKQVAALLSAHESAEDFISQPALVEAGIAGAREDSFAFAASLIGKRIGQYAIVRELGRGGMGAVFLANQGGTDFNRQVALKIIKRGMDTDAILQRFVIERQILANLHHPNIAGFLDGGTTTDGLPYFVMEYVDGEPITRYCDARRLDTTERLKLFQRACAAVRHAHQNLIVHRDLKPSNILVTQDGTPKLLDFGIAKLVSPDQDRPADDTATAFRVMTPEYASPEQLRGLPITTATDVYSLGVVLYELLSGHRPFRFRGRSPDEIARVVLSTDPLPPSERLTRGDSRADTARDDSPVTSAERARCNPKSLRGDLDNIVLKAVRRERERRYASVLELSEDIRRHLAGLPVTARPDTFTYRAGKFIQRHRAVVTMASVFFMILLAATAVTSWQGYVARREHARAELRAAEQRKLASSLIYEVQTSLRDTSHSLTAQKLLAQKSIEYLNNLAKDAGDDPKFLGELADAYRNLGYLQAWTLQDNTSALLTYQRAIDLARRRIAIEPKSTAAQLLLADALGNRIESLNLLQRPEDTAATYSEKLPIEEQLSSRDPQNPEGLMRVAETAQAYGETLQSIHQDDEAKALFQKSIELGIRSVDLFKAQTNTPQQRVDLALMEEKLGSMFEKLDEGPEAIQTYREAVATASAVHAEHPEIVQGLRNTTSSHWYLGLLLDRQGDHRGALENYRASLKAALDATAADPSIDPWRGAETKYSIVVGSALCKLGETKEGVPLIRNGIELQLRLIESDKGNRQDTYYGSEVLGWAVEGLAAAGLRDEAKSVSLKMIAWANEAAENAPQDGGPRMRLALYYEELGDVYAGYDSESQKIGTSERARLIEAEGWYQKAAYLMRDLTEDYGVSRIIVGQHLRPIQEKLLECAKRAPMTPGVGEG